MKRKKLVRTLGNVLMVIAIVFIGYKLYQYRDKVSDAFTWKIGVVMLVSSLITTSLIIISSVFYANLVARVSDKEVPLGMASQMYCKSNLYKYIPGNVLQYVGRNQIAELSNARHDRVIFASFLEVGFTVIGALTASIILARQYVFEWIRNQNTGLIVAVIAAVTVIVIFISILLAKKVPKLFKELRRILNHRNIGYFVAMIVFIVFNQMLNGIMFTYLMKEIVGTLPKEYWSNVAGVYSFAWLVGFVTPGAPGGMGIREALLSVLLANTVAPEMVTIAVIFNRIVTVLGDLIAYPASILLSVFSSKKKRDLIE